MSDSALLDTNFVIAVFAGEPSAVKQLEALDEVYLPLPVVGELIYGALYSARAEANLARATEFASACAILFPDEATASEYGRLCAALRRKGRRIPDNDAWVAALALQHGLSLMTRDGHFADVLRTDGKGMGGAAASTSALDRKSRSQQRIHDPDLCSLCFLLFKSAFTPQPG